VIRFAQGIPGCIAGAHPGHAIRTFAQSRLEKQPDAALIFDDENFRGRDPLLIPARRSAAPILPRFRGPALLLPPRQAPRTKAW